ncbi:MAG TPA: AarF/ABC1/UbiB kinase family protein [Candidatus Saccharimonadales bacterium]|nr:AarF/ABC1/UbiB kinase family protein [Candidatus Saccharimonadales bacterium]
MNKIKRISQITAVLLLALRKNKAGSDAQYELYEKLLSMGGLYIKFVQLLLVRLSEDREYMDIEFSFLLKKTYDSSPYEPIDIARLLRQELGEGIEQIKSVERDPFAAGSFGQVYKATLKNGETVAIKALRPSVLRDIDFDIKLLGFLVRIVNVGHKGGFDILDVFRKFKSTTLKELDYEREVHYAVELYDRYKNHPTVVIPKTYQELCTKHLITQEYISGVMLTDVLAQKEFGHSPEEYTKQVLGSSLSYQMTAIGQVMLESMFTEGTAHGDPHPGNIKLLPDNRVALLDFGISATAPSDKQAFFKLVQQYQKIYSGNFDIEGYTWAIVNLFVRDLSMAVRSLDMYNHGRIQKQLFTAITESASSIFKNSFSDVENMLHSNKFLRVFSSVINENNRFGFNLEIEQPEFLRATFMYIDLVGSLGIKQNVLNEVYTSVVNKLEHTEMASRKNYVTPEDAVSIIAEWLEKVAAKDIYLYQMLSSKISMRSLSV